MGIQTDIKYVTARYDCITRESDNFTSQVIVTSWPATDLDRLPGCPMPTLASSATYLGRH